MSAAAGKRPSAMGPEIDMKTGRLYSPMPGDDGQIKPVNYLAAAEMSMEGNYNQIDGIINNEAPKLSVTDVLRQCKDEADKQDRPQHGGAPDMRER